MTHIHNTDGPRRQHGDSLVERLAWAVATAALSGMAITAFQHYVDTKYDTLKRVEAVEKVVAVEKQRNDDFHEAVADLLGKIDRRLDRIEGALQKR